AVHAPLVLELAAGRRQDCREHVDHVDRLVGGFARRHVTGPAHQPRHAHAALPQGPLAAAEGAVAVVIVRPPRVAGLEGRPPAAAKTVGNTSIMWIGSSEVLPAGT